MADDANSFLPLAREMLSPPREIMPGVFVLPQGEGPEIPREAWDDYDAGRPDRVSHDVMAREARRLARDKDGF